MELESFIKTADSIVSNHFHAYVRSHGEVGVLLSGGIDSSLITSYVNAFYPDARVFSMGTAGTKDKPFVKLYCSQLKKQFEWIELSDSAISDALPDVKKLLEDGDVPASTMQLSLAVGYYLIFKRVAELGIRAIVTGQGPDILFAGYHKYKALEIARVNEAIRADLPLLETDKKRDGAMAARFGITLLNPYLEPDFVDFSLTVPPELKLRDGVEKYFMREWGKRRGLPDEIVVRPKKAFQYSTGLQKSVQGILQLKK